MLEPEWLQKILTWPTFEVLSVEYRRWLPGDHRENRLLPMPLKYAKFVRYENRRLPMPLKYAERIS